MYARAPAVGVCDIGISSVLGIIRLYLLYRYYNKKNKLTYIIEREYYYFCFIVFISNENLKENSKEN